jgi:ABC-type polysaccharide/polyol phosphate export permease
MTGVADGFRSVFLARPFDIHAIGISMLMSAAVFAVGIAYFEKVERRFADIL